MNTFIILPKVQKIKQNQLFSDLINILKLGVGSVKKRGKKRPTFEEKVYTFRGSIEHERIRTRRPPDRGKRRAKRKKPTPEQIRKQNQYNKEKRVRRLIKQNFHKNDYWVTFVYRKGTRGDLPEALEDRKKLLMYIRKGYKKAGYELKWIGRTEVGKHGAMHHHMIINRIPGGDIIITEAWEKIKDSAWADFVPMYKQGEFKDLAAYVVKPDKEDKDGNPTSSSNYSRSRNLEEPEPDIKRTTLKSIREYPEPTPGYYIDKDSVRQGINPITGSEYLHYIEIELKGGGG